MINTMMNANTINPLHLMSVTCISILIAACQAPVVNPNNSQGSVSSPTVTTDQPVSKPPVVTPSPTQPTEPKSSSKATPTKPTAPKVKPKPVTSKDVLAQQRAKKHTQQSNTNTRKNTLSKRDGSNIPAFNLLIKTGIKQLRSGQLNRAQQTFTKAQRLGPQSPAVYMYLSEIAIKKKQGTQAENLARRGLLVSRSKRYDKALWQMVLISAKMRNRSATVKEAQAQLKRLQ